jgi:hypothetical protein
MVFLDRADEKSRPIKQGWTFLQATERFAHG